MSFLGDREIRPLTLAALPTLRPLGLVLGKGANALEVAIAESVAPPGVAVLKTAWKARLAGRATPLLLVVLYNGRAALCGPGGDQPPAFADLKPDIVERMCATALDEPDRLSLEHILPKSKEWATHYKKFSQDERDASVSKIGNLALLKKSSPGLSIQ